MWSTDYREKQSVQYPHKNMFNKKKSIQTNTKKLTKLTNCTCNEKNDEDKYDTGICH